MEYLLEATQRYIKLLEYRGAVAKRCILEYAWHPDHLLWMLKEIRKLEMSETKANRWLGFVQGVLAADQVIWLEDEVPAMREIFKGK